MFKSSAARSVLPWIRLGRYSVAEDEIAPRMLFDVSLCFSVRVKTRVKLSFSSLWQLTSSFALAVDGFVEVIKTAY